MKYIAILVLLLLPAVAAAASLTITTPSAKHTLTAKELLTHPASRKISIEKDISYQAKMHYTAIPVAALFAGTTAAPGTVIEAVATDGFVAPLPADLLLRPRQGGAEAFLAVESPDSPWPRIPGKKASAGPFYIVWMHPEASKIRSEQWPYMIAELRLADAPAKKWKDLSVAPSIPADAAARKGEALFVTQCLACHKMNGGGSADVGPDLNLPMSPTEYFQKDALKKYIREPSSLRRWPAMSMPGFSAETLSDQDINDIIAYMEHMAGRKARK